MIHPTLNLFLALYLTHLLSDFVFRAGRLVSRKQRVDWSAYAVHGATHYLTGCAVVALADPHRMATVGFQLILLSLSLLHLLVDRAKLSFVGSARIPSGTLSFVLEQAIHLAAAGAAALILVHPSLQFLASGLAQVRRHQENILLATVVYAGVIFGGGHFIRELISPLWKEQPGEKAGEHDEVINAGLYIGWLERFLVLTALVLQSPATVGFILAAKSIARYPELKSVRFAEYFLIGTLLSMSFAIAGALVLLKVFHGAVALGR